MAESTTPSSSNNQPKIVQKLWTRTLIAVLLIGGLFLGIRWYLSNQTDLKGVIPADTTGQIAAIEMTKDGQQAVVFLPNGEVLRSPEYREGATDRDLAWQPNGNRLFFVSDRGTDGFQVYRWRPVAGGEVEVRSVGSRGKSNPAFPAEALPDANTELLMTSGGFVLSLEPSKPSSQQMLPPVSNELATAAGEEEGSGAASQFTALYGQLGDSFRLARWVAGKQAIAAVMRRDMGEILIVQRMPQPGKPLERPELLAAGERIELSVNPKNGGLVYAVQNFQWPGQPPAQFVKNGKVTRPFSHFVGIWTFDQPEQTPIIASNEDEVAFGSPAVSPDGSRLLLVVGNYDGASVSPRELITLPAQSNGAQGAARLFQGAIYDPAWSPTGDKIAYVKRDTEGKRNIYVANADGSAEKNLSQGKGDFSSPKFSPQLKP